MNPLSCPKCGAELPAGSAFCNRCGAPLGAAPATALPSPAPAARPALLGALGLPLLAILWTLAVRKLSVSYRLTTHLLFRDRGILWRRADEIELIRVDDVAVRQNLIQRLFNVGVVEVISPTDPTEPRLELEGIENPIEVKERIRTQVRRRRDRSLHVESL